MRFLLRAGSAVLFAACAGQSAAPEPGFSTGLVPDLRGVPVMVFPVQEARGLPADADPDGEVAFALSERGAVTGWIWPADIRAIAARTPGLAMNVDGLPVGMFLQAEVRRVGDPLYGNLRRVSAVANSEVALIPIQVRTRSDADGEGTVEIAATLVQTRTGRVLWFGIVADPGSGGGARAGLARAAGLLARAILPLGA